MDRQISKQQLGSLKQLISRKLGTAFGADPNNMIGYGISCLNRRKRKKIKYYQKH